MFFPNIVMSVSGIASKDEHFSRRAFFNIGLAKSLISRMLPQARADVKALFPLVYYPRRQGLHELQSPFIGPARSHVGGT